MHYPSLQSADEPWPSSVASRSVGTGSGLAELSLCFSYYQPKWNTSDVVNLVCWT